MKSPVDQGKRVQNRLGNPTVESEETRRLKSQAMKEFNRKTGKNTALGNLMSRKSRKPK